MPDLRLLQSQRSQVFQAIQQAGFDPADFELTDVAEPDPYDTIVTTIVHRPSRYYLTFGITRLPRRLGNARCVVYSPGQSTPQESQIAPSWPAQLSAVEGIWLPLLRRELEAPDLWGRIESERDEERRAARGTTSEVFDSALTAIEAQETVALLTRIEARLIERQQLEGERARVREKPIFLLTYEG
jgi:hypothetical protein